MAEVKRMRSAPPPAPAAPRSRSFTRRTGTGPIPVWTRRSGAWPCRTTRSRPSGSRAPCISARNASASASTACASKRRAPLLRTAVSGSSIVSGWRRGMTVLSLIVAYRSFGRFWQARHPPRYAAFLTPPSPSFGHSSPGDRRDGGDLLPLAPGVRRAEGRPSEAAEGVGGGERPAAQGGGGPDVGQADPRRGRPGKLLGPARRRACIEHVRRVLSVSERRAGAALGQHRSTQRKAPRGRDDEERLTADIIELARQYGRYGYRKVTALLRDAGGRVNEKRVERIWRREGLKVPPRQPKRGRLWLADGSCTRLQPERPNQ